MLSPAFPFAPIPSPRAPFDSHVQSASNDDLQVPSIALLDLPRLLQLYILLWSLVFSVYFVFYSSATAPNRGVDSSFDSPRLCGSNEHLSHRLRVLYNAQVCPLLGPSLHYTNIAT